MQPLHTHTHTHACDREIHIKTMSTSSHFKSLDFSKHQMQVCHQIVNTLNITNGHKSHEMIIPMGVQLNKRRFVYAPKVSIEYTLELLCIALHCIACFITTKCILSCNVLDLIECLHKNFNYSFFLHRLHISVHYDWFVCIEHRLWILGDHIDWWSLIHSMYDCCNWKVIIKFIAECVQSTFWSHRKTKFLFSLQAISILVFSSSRW